MTDSSDKIRIELTDESLEPGPLTGPGLLLHGHDLQHLVLESGANEHVDYIVLFDGQRVEVDLLQAVLHQAAQLGHGDPLLVLLAAATAASSAAPPRPRSPKPPRNPPLSPPSMKNNVKYAHSLYVTTQHDELSITKLAMNEDAPFMVLRKD